MKDKFLLRDDRAECSTLWDEVKKTANGTREMIAGNAYAALRTEVYRVGTQATEGDPYETLRAIQVMQQEMRAADLFKEQREILRDALQKHWDAAIRRIEERKAERAECDRAWRARNESRAAKLEGFIERKEAWIDRLREEAAELESKIDSAWNEDWADRARGWLQEKYAKIAEAERQIADLEEQLRELRSKLAG